MFEPSTDTTSPSDQITVETNSAHASTHLTQPPTTPAASNKKRRDKAPSIVTATPDALVEAAVKAAEAINSLRRDSTDQIELLPVRSRVDVPDHVEPRVLQGSTI